MIPGCVFWGFTPWWLIQSYWIVWLVIPLIISFVLGAVILRNWEAVK